MSMAGSGDRRHRLVAFGIFWYLIALVPVSNLIPTSTKMADRYLFVPSIGAILSLLALAVALLPRGRRQQLALYGAFTFVVILYTAWSYKRTEVWCGKTTEWNGRPQPDLSLWTAAVENDPENTFALNSLGLAYLRLSPPETDKALVYLNRALQTGETSQSKIAGERRLILTPVYENLGDGYLTQASRLNADELGSPGWQNKKEAYVKAVKYFELASKAPSGFASSDARVLSRFAEATEGQAQMDSQELAVALQEQRAPLIRERDELRSQSEESLRHAREVLTTGNVTSTDPNYRTVILGQGNIIFGREVGPSDEEKVDYYRQALVRYIKRPPNSFLMIPAHYYTRDSATNGSLASPDLLRKSASSLPSGRQRCAKALTLNIDAPDYSSGLAHKALASLYAHVNDFQSVLDSLKKAQRADPVGADSSQLDREIQSVEQYLAQQNNNR
jgi:tetratricopeptide (TPR) repeat protein